MFTQINDALQRAVGQTQLAPVENDASKRDADRKHMTLLTELKAAANVMNDMGTKMTRSFTDVNTALTNQNAVLAVQAKQIKELQDKVTSVATSTAKSSHVVDSKSTSLTQPSSTQAKPRIVDPKEEIQKLIADNNFEAAFTKALSSAKPELVAWLCSILDPRILFATAVPSHKLSNPVIISLIQQLSFQLMQQPVLKLSWIKEALMTMDSSDSLISEHVPHVMAEVVRAVDTCLQQLNVSDPTDPVVSIAKNVKALSKPLAMMGSK
jgi:predicted RNA-binding protein